MIMLGVVAEELSGAPPVLALFVQSEYVSRNAVSSATVNFPGPEYSLPITPGDLLLVYVQMAGTGETLTVADNAGNIYVKLSGPDDNPAEPARRYLFMCNGVVTAPTAITATLAGGSTALMMFVTEISGQNTFSPIDQLTYAPYHATGTEWIFSTITTTQINELVFCFFGSEQNYALAGVGTGWAEAAGENDGGIGQTGFNEYQDAPTVAAFTGTANLSFPQTIDTAAYVLSVRGA